MTGDEERDPYIIHEENGPSAEQVEAPNAMAERTKRYRPDERVAFHVAQAVGSDYPELSRLAAGHSVHAIEDAEEQADAALHEIRRLRTKAKRLREIQDELLVELAKRIAPREGD